MKKKAALVGHWFHIFHTKNTPEHFSITYQGDKSVDLYEVWVSKGESPAGYLFEKLEGEDVLLNEWNEETLSYDISASLKLSDISPHQISGIHYYHGRRIYFFGLEDLQERSRLWRKLGYWLNDKFTSYSQRRYNQEQHRIDDRMKVLDEVIQMYLLTNPPRPVNKTTVANQIHTSNWRQHPESGQMLSELNLVLSSFVVSGELTEAGGNGYTPTGKAYATQAEHRLQSQRHRDNTRIQIMMFIATLLSAVAAIGSALAAFLALK